MCLLIVVPSSFVGISDGIEDLILLRRGYQGAFFSGVFSSVAAIEEFHILKNSCGRNFRKNILKNNRGCAQLFSRKNILKNPAWLLP